MLAMGVIDREAQLRDDDNLLSRVLYEWIRGGQMACAFAKRLARSPKQAGWDSYVDRTIGTDDFPSMLNDALVNLSEEAEAVQIILPGAVTAADTAGLVGQLCLSGQWFWEEIPWEGNHDGKTLKCGLRWTTPDGQYHSWVLGFAPFHTLPFTRRLEGAPFSALLLRPCPPSDESDPQFGSKDPAALHLAMMPHGLDEQRSKLFLARTSYRRREFLAGNGEEMAKAAVTFCFPEAERASLGPPSK